MSNVIQKSETGSVRKRSFRFDSILLAGVPGSGSAADAGGGAIMLRPTAAASEAMRALGLMWGPSAYRGW